MMSQKWIALILLIPVLGWAVVAGGESGSVGELRTPPPASQSAKLITQLMTSGQEGDRLAVIDPHAKTLAVYHVARESGEIRLESVRKMAWDLQMVSFNSSQPTPREIQAGLQRQP